jgi:hypothetical protein
MVPSTRAYKMAMRWFRTVNLFFIPFGAGVFALDYYICHDTTAQEYALKFYTGYNRVPAYIMYISGSILVGVGLIGLLSSFLDNPYLFDCHEGFMLTALALNLVASGASSVISTRITKSE